MNDLTVTRSNRAAWSAASGFGSLAWVLSALLAACGGGGSDAGTPASPSSASAQATAPASGKLAWRVQTPLAITLTKADGSTVSGTLSCSADSSLLTVATDCSQVTGLRLGSQTINVSGGGVTAQATLKVIPPAQPIGTHGITGQDGGGDYNLVVTPAGGVLTWGTNSSLQLGQGRSASDLPSSSLPLPVVGIAAGTSLGGIVAVSAGATAALALSEDGAVYSWGTGSSTNTLGRAAVQDSRPGNVLDATATKPLTGIVAIAIGNDNAAALGDDGTVYVWGNYAGSTISGQTYPTLVQAPEGGNLSHVVALSAGGNWTAALLADGRVVTWGYNASEGWLGHNTTVSAEGPGYVLTANGSQLSGVGQVSAGYNFGLARMSDGSIMAWGNDSYGQLGRGTHSDHYPYAQAVLASGGSAFTGIRMVAAGGNQALAMNGSGQVWSWGYSQNGELGDGATHPRVNSSAVPAAVVDLTGVNQLGNSMALAAGFGHSLALRNDGTLAIWGAGYAGDLGQGGTSTSNSYVPELVKDISGSDNLSLGPISYWPNLLQSGL